MADKEIKAKAFFNAIPTQMFLKMLENISEGMGYVINEIYGLPQESLRANNVCEGVRVGNNFDGDILLSNADFIIYAEDACASYLRDHPQQQEKLDMLKEKLRLKFPVPLA